MRFQSGRSGRGVLDQAVTGSQAPGRPALRITPVPNFSAVLFPSGETRTIRARVLHEVGQNPRTSAIAVVDEDTDELLFGGMSGGVFVFVTGSNWGA